MFCLTHFCPKSRGIRRVDSLLRSVLDLPEKDRAAHAGRNPSRSPSRRARTRITPPGLSSSPAPTPGCPRDYVITDNVYRTPRIVKATDRIDLKQVERAPYSPGILRTPAVVERGRGTWLLWAFYAKFAERCLWDQELALFALESAVAAAAAVAPPLGPAARCFAKSSHHDDGRGSSRNYSNCTERAVPLTLIARAQFYQRWPTLFQRVVGCAKRLGHSSKDLASLEGTFADISKR